MNISNVTRQHWDTPFGVRCLDAAANRVDRVVREGTQKICTALVSLPDRVVPHIGDIYKFVQRRFSDLDRFNKWLDDNGQGNWYWQLATCLYKLPMRAVRDIVELLYQIIKTCVAMLIQPHKIPTRVAILLISLVAALTKPETWAQMGAGAIGASLGQCAVGNPFAVIGFGIGAAMLLGGVSVGAIKTAIEAKSGSKLQEVGYYLRTRAEKLATGMLSSFFIGLILGGIERALRVQTYIPTQEEAHKFAVRFCKEHNLPPPTNVVVGNHGIDITFEYVSPYYHFWDNPPQNSIRIIEFVRQKLPEITNSAPGSTIMSHVHLKLHPEKTTVEVVVDKLRDYPWTITGDDWGWPMSDESRWYTRHYWMLGDRVSIHEFPLSDITKISGVSYPLPPKLSTEALDPFHKGTLAAGVAHARTPDMPRWACRAITYLSEVESKIDTLCRQALRQRFASFG